MTKKEAAALGVVLGEIVERLERIEVIVNALRREQVGPPLTFPTAPLPPRDGPQQGALATPDTARTTDAKPEPNQWAPTP